jgi:lysophospholipase L1-like esterase
MNKILKRNICILAAIAVLACSGQRGVSRASQSGDVSANTAVIAVQKLEPDFYDWYQRHKEVVELINQRQVDLIFIGDSITHMFGGLPKSPIARGSRTWDKYYGHRNAINMGFGWDRTQNVLWRLEHGELEGIAPKVAVLLIGTNNRTGTQNARQNTPAEIAAGVSAICTTIHKKAPKCQILLLGVLPRSPRHFVKPIEEINKRLAPLKTEAYITFLNMRDQFGDKEGLPKKELMHDGVHPNAAGYRVWAKTMEPVLSKLLNDQAVMPNALDAGDGK